MINTKKRDTFLINEKKENQYIFQFLLNQSINFFKLKKNVLTPNFFTKYERSFSDVKIGVYQQTDIAKV